MAKEISGFIKLQIKGGQANPAPPVGPALGQRGVNIMEFCKAFNDKTKSMAGKPVPVEITVYKDKKFDFINVDINPPKKSKHREYWNKIDIRNKQKLLDIIKNYKPTHVINLAADLYDTFSLFKTKDKSLAVILVADPDFETLCKFLDCNLHETPEFSTLLGRVENASKLTQEINSRLQKLDSSFVGKRFFF